MLDIGPGVELPLSIATQKNAILAMTGMGKTYLAKRIAEEMLDANVQIVVFDYTGVWWGLASSANGKKAGYDVTIFGGDHGHVGLNENAGSLLADVAVETRRSLVIDFSGFEYDAPKVRLATDFARRLYHKNKRPIHLIIDEADEFVPQNVPKAEKNNPYPAMLAAIKRIWQRGRVKGIGGTLISQRSALVNKSLLSQSNMLIALRTVAPQDRAALEAWFSSWGTQQQIMIFEQSISNLKDHEAWFWSPGHNIFTRGKASKLVSFDSGKTPDFGDALAEPEVIREIDVAKLGKQIEKLSLEAKADDPAALRKQVEHYREQFETAKKRYVLLEERLKKREKVIQPGKPVKVPAISPRSMKALKRAAKEISKARTGFEQFVSGALQAFVSEYANCSEGLLKDIQRAEALIEKNASRAMQMHTPPIDVELQDVGELTVPSSNGKPPAEGLKGGKLRILQTLAQYRTLTLSRLRAHAGIKTLPTLSTYVSKLKSAGFVSMNGDAATITPAGLDAAGEVPPPLSGRRLVEHWKNELGDHGKGKIFAAMIDSPGSAFSIAQLMKATGIDSQATAATYVSKLKTLGVIEGKDPELRIAEGFRGGYQI